jgi:sigma-B regulation protein RsbU (phosphoserine phosphatase)
VVPGFDIAGALYAADYAAGDFFDYIHLPDGRIAVVVGDVCGKGFSSALVAASTHELLRAAASVRLTAEDMVTHANVALSEETEDGMFVTLVFLLFDFRSRTVEFVNAGHPDGYVLDRHGRVKQRLSSSAGLLALSAESRFEQGPRVQLDPGDLLLVFTDGVLEARSSVSADGDFNVQRTLDVVRRNVDKPAKDIVAAIHQAVYDFSENHKVMDDVTIVVVKCLGE